MWNKICEFFASRCQAVNEELELVDALFNWQYKN